MHLGVEVEKILFYDFAVLNASASTVSADIHKKKPLKFVSHHPVVFD